MQTKEIKTKIKSVGNIKKITRTMEMVSVAKMRKTTKRALSSQPYARFALELLVNLASNRELSHPYLEETDKETALVVIVGSNKGLCGAYNMNINKIVRSLTVKEKDIKAVTIGKQAERIARRNSIPVVASFTNLGDLVTTDEVASVIEVLVKEFMTGNFGKVLVASTNYIKMMDYKPNIIQLLPITKESLPNIAEAADVAMPSKDSLALYEFEPSAEDVLEEAANALLMSVVFQTLLESSAAEHSSRMVAMKGATDNASSLMEALQLSYNKARQEAITREISEIAAGGEATSQ